MFNPVNPKQSFPNLEQEIINFWKENQTFKKSVDTRSECDEFNFYDGPPFATGTPHYGHILAGTIKDVVPRYQTMLGHKVERRFGWDCHGLPIEGIVEKKLGIKSKKEIDENIGTYKFNEECRANVLTYTGEWRKTVERMGRWVDMDNDYKTMDKDFMESVWWVFSELYKKGLIYQDYRVVPYSVGMSTPLSNFEVNQGYKDKQDKTLTVKFKIKSDKVEAPYRESTGVVVKNSKGQVLLGLKKKNGLLTFPGGKTEVGESALECAKRELFEETGIQAENLELYYTGEHLNDGVNWKNSVYTYLVPDDFVPANPESHKFDYWNFFNVDEVKLDENVIENHSIIVIETLKGLRPATKTLSNGGKYLLAWTTTPWTLVANLGLAVGENVTYVELLDKKTGETYILAKGRVGSYYKNEEDYQIVREYPGSCLVGLKYEPLYEDFVTLDNLGNLPMGQKIGKNAFSVVLGHHVTDDSGTGIVHIAPAYGEDDYKIGKEKDLGFVAHIDDNGYTENLLENNGTWVFDFNEMAIETMKKTGLSVKIDTIVHSYPHCWRTDIPLIYRAISAWYVKVEAIKDKMLKANDNINWVPENLKYGRFGKWLEGARDWNISRNRYWGSALPVWQSEDKRHEVCIGSIEELYELNKDFGQIEKKGDKYFYTNTGKEIDLHKHFVDDIFLADEKNFKAKKVLAIHGFKRNSDVIDFIEGTKINLGKDGVNIDAPTFELGTNISYKNWETKLNELDIKKYDTILCHSLGCRVAMEYIIENKINIKRLVLVAPGLESKTEEVNNFYKELKNDFSKIKNFVEELIIIASKDDTVHRQNGVKELIKLTESNFVQLDGYGHFNLTECKIIEGIVKNGAPLKRIPEVLDCWFESGSMPYASKHFPFENKENFKFPANFIAEGIDQTRGWFYTLVVLSAALFDKNPFQNVIANGIVLAEDGKKMSKRLQNYTDPTILMDRFGADAMRFYLMNSPVVQAEDIRFSDAGVEEVVKKVILPLWNTYSFFTTYANIDNFEPKNNGNIFYVRHGETQNNAEKRMNGGEVDTLLNETGEKQALKAGQNFALNGVKLDKIYISPRLRTKKTAELIVSKLGYEVEIIEDERLLEQNSGKFSEKTHKEIMEMTGAKNNYEMRRAYKEENGVENLEEFEKRVLESYNEIKANNVGKNVLIVGHAGVFRPLNRYLNDLTKEEAHFDGDSVSNGVIYKLPDYVRKNPLDKWIISELNTLTRDMRKALDNYKLNEAAKPIVRFMDNLTNWYVRRSRKRFWGGGMNEDKLSAYNTLYEVLVETCKIIAPYMPFVSENIFKNLSEKESVHLELYPEVNKAFIFEKLNESTKETQEIITLGLAARANAKLRVRQPLSYVKISHKLDEYYENIIKEELNVKQVLVFAENELPKKICKPNARLIGPKFGGDVKFIISEAKLGNFEELADGKVKVGEFILESGEFEIEFLGSETAKNENEIIESGNGMVVALDKNITEELKQEGYVRDIVRHIQESRKEANYNVDDRIKVELIINNEKLIINEKNKEYIENETLSSFLENISDPDLEKEVEIEDIKIILKLKR